MALCSATARDYSQFDFGLTDLRGVGLEINGDDLLAAGVPQGPEIGARLQRTLDRKLDGEIAGREQELATALGRDGG